MTIVLADAALPNLRSAGLLPGGDLAAEFGIACREILSTVVALPIHVFIAAAAGAHTAGRAPTLSNTWTQWPTSTKAWAQASPDRPAPMIAMVLLLLSVGLGVIMAIEGL